MFNQLTFPTITPLGLDEVKLHLNLTTPDFDQLLTAIIQAATVLVEKEINSPLLTGEYEYYTDTFCFPITIPKGNVQTISAFEYRDLYGTWYDVPNGVWDSAALSGRGVVFLKPQVSFSFPSLYSYKPVRLTFTAGFGDTPDSVPALVLCAIKIICANLFENRETAMSGMPMPAAMLLSHYRAVYSEMF